MRRGAGPQVRAAAVGAALAGLALGRGRPRPGGGWLVPNYRGRPVSLLAGPAWAAAAAAGGLAGAGGTLTRPRRAAVVLLAAAAALAGRIDDRAGPGGPKGLRGHLAAGPGDPGVAKAAVLAAAGPLAAGALGAPPLVGGGLVAAGAAVANLLDVRPGRALKAAVGAGTVLAGTATTVPARALAAAVAGAGAALLPADLSERAMLGDCGALAGGALLGLAGAAGAGPRARRRALAVLLAAVLLAEVVSLSQLVEGVAPLRWWDGAGRRC